MNAWPLDEGLIDYVDAAYGGATDENPYAAINVIANPSFTLSGETVDASTITPGPARGHAAGGGRDRGERRHRLSRDRVPALGAGPERHRAGRRQPAVDRLRGGRGLHRRQLRPARRLSEGGDRPARSPISSGSSAQWGEGGEARAAVTGGPGRRRRRDPDRHGQPLLRRAGRRADAARADAARPRGGARLLLGQHLQQPLLRRARDPERLSRALRADRRQRRRGAVGVGAGRRDGSGGRRRPAAVARRDDDGARRDQDGRRGGHALRPAARLGERCGRGAGDGGDRRADRADPVDRAGGLGA